MVYRYRQYRKKKLSGKSRKYTRRSRFSNKKKFLKYKNNNNMLNIRPLTIARNLNVKLPWVKTFNDDVLGSGSKTYVFQGNTIIPHTSLSSGHPSSGDNIPSGLLQYSQFYNKGIVYGSSIKIEIVNPTVQTSVANGVFRAVLISVPFTNQTDDGYEDTISQLNSYTYEQLLSWPGAKWKMISSSSGSNNRCFFKMFRKTKSMVGVKDMRDQINDNNDLSVHLPDGETVSTSYRRASTGFIYYLKLFNLSTNVQVPDITVRMKLYMGMTQREFIPTSVITAL